MIEILGLEFNGTFIDEVDPLRKEIKGYFVNQFSSGDWDR